MEPGRERVEVGGGSGVGVRGCGHLKIWDSREFRKSEITDKIGTEILTNVSPLVSGIENLKK